MRQKKRVVAYVRVSTLEQKKHGYGIEIQIRDVTLYSERHGLFVERFYRDEGESGAKEHRRALQALLRACRRGFISTIILPSLDRLSRQVRIAENLFHEFQTLGIAVLIADMPHYRGDRKDILIRQILEAVAEDNRREIIDRLLKGREARVRRGLFPGGTLPYGYRRNGESVVVDPVESEVVRRIHELGARGLTGQAIADVLNKGGSLRRNGKPWTQRQVASILARTELYRDGVLRYGESRGRSEETILRAA